jgi:hypothetical protein
VSLFINHQNNVVAIRNRFLFIWLKGWSLFKWKVLRDFCIRVFHESSSPKPLKITFGSFRIFSKNRGEICKSRCTTCINDTDCKFCHRYRWCRISRGTVSLMSVDREPFRQTGMQKDKITYTASLQKGQYNMSLSWCRKKKDAKR